MAWKTFKFFEKEILKDPDTKGPFEGLADLSVTCVTGGRGKIVVGDAHGRFHFLTLSGGYVSMATVQAYEHTVLHLLQLKQSNILISVGFDDPDFSILKIWDSSKTDRGGVAPIRTIKPQQERRVQITCLGVDERQSLLAVGYVNGTVLLIRGNLARYWSSKQLQLPLNFERPITGLAFSSWKQDTFLYLTTEKNVYSFKITANPTEQNLTRLGDFGCRQGCSVMSDSSQDNKFVVASNEVASFYLPLEAAQCFGFEGLKMMVNWFRGHLLEVKRVDKPAPMSAPMAYKEQNIITIYDIQNQFIAFSLTLPSGVLGVVPEWGVVNVLTSDGRITLLREHDTQSKLESLFKRNLFDYAVNLARNQSYDDGLAEILRRYGDHLYSKGDYRGAIEQYKNAIRFIEPSYVIRKFLDAQQIENLTSYLKALHDEGIAKSDHTTLLLNCYTKLQDQAKLEEFIQQCRPDREGFNVEAAIRVCRQAGFHQHAVTLASNHAHHNLYVLIQVEDLKEYKTALLYIEKLSFDEAQTHLKMYGKSLMAAEPDLTSGLITSLCLGHWKNGGGSAQLARPEEFIHIFVIQQDRLVRFLESSLKNIPQHCNSAVYNTLLELYLSKDSCSHLSTQERETKIMDLLRDSEKYDLHHALVLAEMHDFQAGVLYLYEHRLKMFQPILQFHMEHKNEDKVMETCRRYGQQDQNLWVSALQHFARSSGPGAGPASSHNIREILDSIERYNLLPPLMVVEILSRSAHTKLGDVKDYIASKLHQENDAIAKDERQIADYQEKTAKMKVSLEDLHSKARVFQVMKCEACKSGLRLPAIHFLCQHSYHLNCLEEGEDGRFHCPTCAEENQTVTAILQELESEANIDEDFHRQLERKRGDGFSVIADYFGRGVMNRTLDRPSSPRMQ